MLSFSRPAGFKQYMEVKGDLDNDSIDEIVYVFDTNKKDPKTGYSRILYICKVVSGKIKIWKTNATVLKNSKECGFCIDAGQGPDVEIRNNALIITQTFNANNRNTSSTKNVFRFQNGGWFLIGTTVHDYDTCAFDFKYDINFSTKQVDIAETYGNCYDEDNKLQEDQFYHFKYPVTTLISIDGFKTGKRQMRIPNTKKTFYY